MEWDIGYPEWFYNKIFGEEKLYNAYVASLVDDTGNRNQIIGYIMLELSEKRNYSHIQGLFVEEKYRHRGIAKRLINEAENYSKSIGSKRITASVAPRLLRFYNNLGFSISKELGPTNIMILKNLEKSKEIEDDDLEL